MKVTDAESRFSINWHDTKKKCTLSTLIRFRHYFHSVDSRWVAHNITVIIYRLIFPSWKCFQKIFFIHKRKLCEWAQTKRVGKQKKTAQFLCLYQNCNMFYCAVESYGKICVSITIGRRDSHQHSARRSYELRLKYSVFIWEYTCMQKNEFTTYTAFNLVFVVYMSMKQMNML